MSISLIIAIATCAGFILGSMYSTLTAKKNIDGLFIVNLSDPNDETFKLQIHTPLEKIPDAKYLIFKVKKVQ